ncbi:hypothetical protein R1sor_004665 [Riccia sorocarpa]|uniref:Uncharacterized protein n=1 Tax=Riccia sorocarpa TaxID=122646 RepID=A0ABD3HLA4_9MARC
MWPLQRKSGGSSSTKPVTEPSNIIKLLLRKRYTKLGPAGDYEPSTSKFSLFGFGSARQPDQNDHTDTDEIREHGNDVDDGVSRMRRSASTSALRPDKAPRKMQRSLSATSMRRSAVQKFGDTYADLIWSATAHVAKPGRPKRVPARRAIAFEKVFGEPHDTVHINKSLQALHAELTARQRVKIIIIIRAAFSFV